MASQEMMELLGSVADGSRGTGGAIQRCCRAQVRPADGGILRISVGFVFRAGWDTNTRNGAFREAEHGATGPFSIEVDSVNLRGPVLGPVLSSFAAVQESLGAGNRARNHTVIGIISIQNKVHQEHPDLPAIK